MRNTWHILYGAWFWSPLWWNNCVMAICAQLYAPLMLMHNIIITRCAFDIEAYQYSTVGWGQQSSLGILPNHCPNTSQGILSVDTVNQSWIPTLSETIVVVTALSKRLWNYSSKNREILVFRPNNLVNPWREERAPILDTTKAKKSDWEFDCCHSWMIKQRQRHGEYFCTKGSWLAHVIW